MSLFPRYCVAIVVAFVVSMTTMFLLAMLAESLQLSSRRSAILNFVGPFLFNALIGFLGVFVGTLCLPRRHRVSGAVVLLVLGASFEIVFFTTLPGSHAGFPRGVLATAPGGLAAVALHFWLRRANIAR